MPSTPVSEGQVPSSGDGPPHVSFQTDVTVIEDAGGEIGVDKQGGDSTPAENDDDASSSATPVPLHHSTRLKGYMTLLVSAIYNYIAAHDNLSDTTAGVMSNMCIYYDNLGNLVETPLRSAERVRFAMATSMITIIVTCAIIVAHFDFCTPLRKSLWPKWFGPHSKVELGILLVLIIFWFVATWLNTSIRGPAGEGNDAYNLYFSSWLCCWATFWTLERWCTASGRASFERFVRSWPNRCPLWIVTFMMSLAVFLFALDLFRHWEDGTKYSPYVLKLYSEVGHGEWTLLLFVTSATFVVSFGWVLAEIFRENRTNVDNVKSAVEVYAEGLSVQVMTVFWIVTVCISTMPGGAASLLGNLYFTTWYTLFAVIGTLIWWIRDWRKDILDVIDEQQEEYEEAKRTIKRREEKRLAKLALEQNKGDGESEVCSTEEEGDDDVLCEDDLVEGDITLGSDFNRSRLDSSTTSLGSGAFPDASPEESGYLSSTRSLFASAVSYFYGDESAVDESADQ